MLGLNLINVSKRGPNAFAAARSMYYEQRLLFIVMHRNRHVVTVNNDASIWYFTVWPVFTYHWANKIKCESHIRRVYMSLVWPIICQSIHCDFWINWVYILSVFVVHSEYGLVTMIVPASGHQVRCTPWVQIGTFNKEIGFLYSLHWIYFVGNTSNGVYIWCCKYGENRYCERCANK